MLNISHRVSRGVQDNTPIYYSFNTFHLWFLKLEISVLPASPFPHAPFVIL